VVGGSWLVVRVAAALLVIALLLTAAGTHAARDRLPQNLVLSGRWGVPSQEPDSREVRYQRWKLKVRLEADGTFAGSGEMRVGPERAAGNVLGRFSGYEMQAKMFTDDGVQMVQLSSTITRLGVRGTFLTIAGEDGWFETTNKGFMKAILE